MIINKDTFKFNPNINPAKFLWKFLKTESASGVLLIIFSILAIMLANSELSSYYYSLKNSYISIGFNDFYIKETAHHFVNDGLMYDIFFSYWVGIKKRND